MLSKQRIEPTPTVVEAGLKIEPVTWKENLLYREAIESSHCISDYWYFILTGHGFISATLRF